MSTIKRYAVVRQEGCVACGSCARECSLGMDQCGSCFFLGGTIFIQAV